MTYLVQGQYLNELLETSSGLLETTESVFPTYGEPETGKSRNQMIIASILFVVSIIVSFLFKRLGFFNLVYDSIFGVPKQIK